MSTYKIIRFHQDGPDETVTHGLSLEAAQAHCRRVDTHGEGWFDGYEEEPPAGAPLDGQNRSGALE